jgi:hypothetical protein
MSLVAIAGAIASPGVRGDSGSRQKVIVGTSTVSSSAPQQTA